MNLARLRPAQVTEKFVTARRAKFICFKDESRVSGKTSYQSPTALHNLFIGVVDDVVGFTEGKNVTSQRNGRELCWRNLSVVPLRTNWHFVASAITHALDPEKVKLHFDTKNDGGVNFGTSPFEPSEGAGECQTLILRTLCI